MKVPNINNSSIHFAILVKQMENMIKLVCGLLLISIVLITCRSADSYYIGKIPTSTIIILYLYEYKQEEKYPIENKEFTDCSKLQHSITQL